MLKTAIQKAIPAFELNSMVEKTVAFVTLGCKANALESSALAERFNDLGWQVLNEHQPASLYVFNTCNGNVFKAFAHHMLNLLRDGFYV